jgi:hypothetical protein
MPIKHTPETCPAPSVVIIPGDTENIKEVLGRLKSGVACHCDACRAKWKEAQNSLRQLKQKEDQGRLKFDVACNYDACRAKCKEAQNSPQQTKQPEQKEDRIGSHTIYIGVLGVGICLLTWLACKKKA